jgi:succinate-semialdehyde dehydrogenase/glutarate-semialdehyde dehydrogenase
LSEEAAPITNPSTGEIIAKVPPTPAGQARAAVDRSRNAQASWAQLSIPNRCREILKWRHAIADAGDRLASLIASENGKPLHEAWLHEIAPLCDTLTWLADEGPRLLASAEVSLRWMKHQRSQYWRKPRGVCAVIAPYNFPLFIPFADAAAALVSGCSVIVKPSERTPLIALAVTELARSVGFDPDLLQVLPGGPSVAEQLLASGVNEAVFTGSTEHGRQVAVRCSQGLVPCTLELGGGASAIVFPDADISQAAAAITFGALANSGQSCIAIERVFATASTCNQLVEAITENVNKLRQGNPLVGEVDLGAMTSAPQLTVVEQQVQAAVAHGARLLCGGRRVASAGNFYMPTVLAGCKLEMDVIAGETFGPVIPIAAVGNPALLIEQANQCQPSLAAYLFGRDTEHLCTQARRIDTNHVLINDVLWNYVCPELPFGGHGASGWGVVHGPEGLMAHTYAAHIGRPRVRLPTSFGFGFPYAKAPRALLKSALRFFTR